jgi:RHS repeat-associated protein
LANAGHVLAFIPAKDSRVTWNDGWQIVEERDGVNNAENRYIYGTGINEVVKYIKADSANRFFTYDGLGSMTEVTGGDGNLQESYTYEVYGTVTMRNPGGTIITATGNKNRLHFTGYELDPDTGLYLARNRWYHPRLGRFIQSDPIGLAGGDLNLYRYCRNNPVNWVDPLGASMLAPGAESWHELAKNGTPEQKAFWGDTAAPAAVAATFAIAAAPQILTAVPVWLDKGKGLFSRCSPAKIKLTDAQSKNVSRFEKGLPGSPTPTTLRPLPNNGVSAQATVPGRVPGSSAIYEKQIDAQGKTIQFTKTTIAPSGDIVHVKDKINGTQLP